jgi:hypothetical protein
VESPARCIKHTAAESAEGDEIRLLEDRLATLEALLPKAAAPGRRSANKRRQFTKPAGATSETFACSVGLADATRLPSSEVSTPRGVLVADL